MLWTLVEEVLGLVLGHHAKHLLNKSPEHYSYTNQFGGIYIAHYLSKFFFFTLSLAIRIIQIL
jgi:hypothetical protein